LFCIAVEPIPVEVLFATSPLDDLNEVTAGLWNDELLLTVVPAEMLLDVTLLPATKLPGLPAVCAVAIPMPPASSTANAAIWPRSKGNMDIRTS